MLSYRVQADALGDPNSVTVQLLERAAALQSLEEVLSLVTARDRRNHDVPPGAVLTREWSVIVHRVMVLENGFAFEGKTFDSLSKIAFVITGTNGNEPRFFGLRNKASKERGP